MAWDEGISSEKRCSGEMVGTKICYVRFSNMDQDGIIIAIGSLTRRDLETLGPAFQCAWPLDGVDGFTDLLIAIDEAEEQARPRTRPARPVGEPRAQAGRGASTSSGRAARGPTLRARERSA
jgi:hypothetical protein